MPRSKTKTKGKADLHVGLSITSQESFGFNSLNTGGSGGGLLPFGPTFSFDHSLPALTQSQPRQCTSSEWAFDNTNNTSGLNYTLLTTNSTNSSYFPNEITHILSATNFDEKDLEVVVPNNEVTTLPTKQVKVLNKQRSSSCSSSRGKTLQITSPKPNVNDEDWEENEEEDDGEREEEEEEEEFTATRRSNKGRGLGKKRPYVRQSSVAPEVYIKYKQKKLLEKREKNRVLAAQSRKRKRDKMEQLERENTELRAELELYRDKYGPCRM